MSDIQKNPGRIQTGDESGMNDIKKVFRIETDRLVIREFTPDMAEAVHLNSLDVDNRRFVPDEVFETIEDAQETVDFLIGRYGGTEGPFVRSEEHTSELQSRI